MEINILFYSILFYSTLFYAKAGVFYGLPISLMNFASPEPEDKQSRQGRYRQLGLVPHFTLLLFTSTVGGGGYVRTTAREYYIIYRGSGFFTTV